MAVRTITLTKQAQQTGTSYGYMGYRLVLTAVGTNVTSSIFRHIRRPVDPSVPAGTTEDVFDGLCWPEELVGLPLNNPEPDGDPQFRLATVDLIFRSEREADDALTRIRSDIEDLLTALSKMDVLGPEVVYTITV